MVLLELKNIRKSFSENKVLKGINFDLEKGEVHTLLGENGAGKSTLMNVLFGLYKKDFGEIFYKEEQINIKNPLDALNHGIGMVQQHFTLVPSFSVFENIALGLKKYKFRVNYKEVKQKTQRIIFEYGFNINPDSKIWQLSVGEKQIVEIIKLLYLDTEVLILDEPTAVLTPIEIKGLFQAINKMKKKGKGIIFISHKLNEVIEISDRVSVLKQGLIIETKCKGSYNEKDLAIKMVGKDFTVRERKQKQNSNKSSDTVLNIKNLYVKGEKGNLAVNNLSFSIKRGEILGIAGVSGNGQKELAEAIMGIRNIESGDVIYKNKNINKLNTKKRILKGISYIPEDRKETATCPNLSVKENFELKNFKKNILINEKEFSERSKNNIKKYFISLASDNNSIKYLSGGNMQKVVIARELECKPDLIIAEHPTRGLDIGSMNFVYDCLLKAKKEGAAILLLAGELYEIFNLSDRLGVIYNGQINGYTNPETKNIEKIGLLMAGVNNV